MASSSTLFSAFNSAAEGWFGKEYEHTLQLAALTTLASDATTDFNARDARGYNIFHYCVEQNAIHRLNAIKEGILSLKERNISLDTALNAQVGVDGQTPLHLTAIAGKGRGKVAYEIAKILIDDLKADPTIANLHGKTPDQIAKSSSRRQVLLLKAKHKIEGLSVSSILPFFNRAAKGWFEDQSDYEKRLEDLRLMASDEHIDFSSVDAEGYNVFHRCVIDNADDRLRYIKAGIDILKKKGNFQNNSLEQALNAPFGRQSQTPLHLAAAVGKGAGEPLHTIIDLLLNLGANPKIKNLKGETPDEVAKIGSKRRRRLLTERIEREGLLGCLKDGDFANAIKQIAAGADVNQRDKIENNTTLFIAMQSGLERSLDEDQILSILERLYEKIEPSQRDEIINHQNTVSKESLLSLAVQGNYANIVKFLLSVGADTSLRDWSENTILHIAAKAKKGANIIHLLLKSKAIQLIDARNKAGQIPLHLVEDPVVCALLCLEAPLLINTKDYSKPSSSKESEPTHQGMEPRHYFQRREHYRQLIGIVDAFDPSKPMKEIPKSVSEILIKALAYIPNFSIFGGIPQVVTDFITKLAGTFTEAAGNSISNSINPSSNSVAPAEN